jgi:hypothetical protein
MIGVVRLHGVRTSQHNVRASLMALVTACAPPTPKLKPPAPIPVRLYDQEVLPPSEGRRYVVISFDDVLALAKRLGESDGDTG